MSTSEMGNSCEVYIWYNTSKCVIYICVCVCVCVCVCIMHMNRFILDIILLGFIKTVRDLNKGKKENNFFIFLPSKLNILCTRMNQFFSG